MLVAFVAHEVSFWQRESLNKHDRQDFVHNSMTDIDDFKHLSAKMFVTFVNFASACLSQNQLRKS